MSLPSVNIEVKNGALMGTPETSDGIAGLIVAGTAAPSGMTLGVAKSFYSIDEVKTAGLDDAYDTANSCHAYRQVKEFYLEAGAGAKLWLMIVPPTESMEDIADAGSTAAYAKVMLDAADGEIRILAIGRTPDGAYVPAYTKGIDDDVIAAVTKLEALAASYAGQFIPFVGLIEGRDYQGDAAALEDLRGLGFSRTAVVISGSEDCKDDNSASVGLALGRLAKLPVQRKISRVKDGAIPILDGYFSDGVKVTRELSEAIHDKGYVTMTKYPGTSGYYWANDPTATSLTDDFAYICRRRVIDKAVMIAYATYINELMDEIQINIETGEMRPSIIKLYEGKIKNAVNTLMTARSEISGFSAFMDPKQNVLSSGEVKIVLDITPVAYGQKIRVILGFTNPELNA